MEKYTDTPKKITYKTCNVRASCGHWLPDFWFGVDGFACKSWGGDEEWGRVISYESLCPECYAEKKRFNLILINKQEEMDWMKGKLPEYCCPFCNEEITVDWNDGWEWACKKCGCSELHGTTVVANPWRDE
jgi:hypothetical protein